MAPETEKEILAWLTWEVEFGFDTKEEIREFLYDILEANEPGVVEADIEWINKVTDDCFELHQQDALGWEHPTDFEKLAACFDELTRRHRLICFHNTGNWYDTNLTLRLLSEKVSDLSISVAGYCYYLREDLEQAVNPDTACLELRFYCPDGDEEGNIAVGKLIVLELIRQGFSVQWNETADERIRISKINWQKIPDEEYWGSDRSLLILTGG